MATIGFRLAEGNSNSKVYPEASSQSYKAGDLVKLAAGKVTIISADTDIWGVAGKDATTTTSADAPVYIIDLNQIWMAELDTTSATTQVGEDYGLNIGTAGSMSVDIGDTSTTTVSIIDLYDDAGTTSKARVLVKFHSDHLDSIGA
jgi:hypothetical protein